MPNKLKIWNETDSWDASEKLWDDQAKNASQCSPIQGLKQLPNMPGITPDTAKNLKWKSLKWMLTKDHEHNILRGFFRHPFRYGWRFLQSIAKKKSYSKDGDFFFYGLRDEQEFQELLAQQDVLLVVGFSYCHKPFECPSGRFSDQCIHDAEHPVCQQCFIGKAVHALPSSKTIPLLIPTVHYIGGKIFDVVHAHPDKRVLFLITACEMTLEMFGDWGNMVNIKGIGVRLDGRICNTMKAFELSEQGIKPGLTVVLEPTKRRILNLIKYWREKNQEHEAAP